MIFYRIRISDNDHNFICILLCIKVVQGATSQFGVGKISGQKATRKSATFQEMLIFAVPPASNIIFQIYQVRLLAYT